MTTREMRAEADASSERASLEDAAERVLDCFNVVSDRASPATEQQYCACYSRFSSKSQKDTSIERQYENHIAHAQRFGFAMLPGEHHFFDKRLTGTTRANRTGLAALLALARTGAIRYVFVESIDRLSRRTVDVINIYEELKKLGVEIILTGVSAGPVDDITAVVHGLFAQEQRRKLLSITSAGRRQAARSGANMGRVPYGYRKGASSGELVIVEAEAEVVRRIFRLLHEGVTPSGVARLLNREHVPGPEGDRWYTCTIYGYPRRGLATNTKYCGINLYNQATTSAGSSGGGRRISKPRDLWETARCDAWRIVDPLTWIEVNRKLKIDRGDPGRSTRERASSRSVSIFRERLFCACGSRMTGKFKRTSGFRHLVCQDSFMGRICEQPRYTSLPWIEYEILSEIEQRIICPEAVELFQDEYVAELQRRQDRYAVQASALRAKIDRLSGWLSRSMIDGVTRGLATEDMVSSRTIWTTEREACRAELARIESRVTHTQPDPSAYASLRAQIAALKFNLPMKDETEAEMLLVASLRQLIRKVVVKRLPGQSDYTLSITSSLSGEGVAETTVDRICDVPKATRPGRSAVNAAAFAAARDGRFALSEADWNAVAHLLSGGGRADKRIAMNAALLQMHTGVPISAIPRPWGGQARTRVVERLARDGRLHAAFAALISISSPVVLGLAPDASYAFGGAIHDMMDGRRRRVPLASGDQNQAAGLA